jgi:exodeoxyribonuclease VII large subunit
MLSPDTKILTVSQLTRTIKSLLEQQVGRIWVSGEISNWSRAASGHAYFTIKDQSSQLDAVIFKGRLNRLNIKPENGLEILACGDITVYEQRGRYQIVVTDMQLKGMGALQLAYEKLKKKLKEEGLFDEKHKKPLPLLPRRIGVVTSPTGAAIRDILQVIRRRFSNVHILIYPARVQGTGAAEEIAAGIRVLDTMDVDVMIVGRGGGSLEDLWAFNEEVVVRAIHAAKTPIISAVGHEIDVTLSDFAADKRAPTPSAAAEIVVQEQEALSKQLEQKGHRLQRAMTRVIEQARHRLNRSGQHYFMENPEILLRDSRQFLDELQAMMGQLIQIRMQQAGHRLQQNTRALTLLSPKRRIQQQRQAMTALVERFRRMSGTLMIPYRNRMAPLMAQLNSMSPLAVLSRGYALIWKVPEGELIRQAEDLQVDDEITARFASGQIKARVTERIKEKEDETS